MSGSGEDGNSSNVSFVKALSEFMELFPSIPEEQERRRMKIMLSPCFDSWFEIRDNIIKYLLEWAEKEDKKASGTDTVSATGIFLGTLGIPIFAGALQLADQMVSAFSAGEKAAETRRIIDEVNSAFEQDRAASKLLEKLVVEYFRPNRQKEYRVVKALVESGRNGAFDSVVAQTTLMHLTSTYESYTAEKDTSAHMLSACFAVLNELQTNEAVDKSIKDKIAQFLQVNRVLLEVAQLCTRVQREIILTSHVDAFVLSDVYPFLGITIHSSFASYIIKRMFDYASRPGVSHDIRQIVKDLKRVRDMLQRVREVIENAEL